MRITPHGSAQHSPLAAAHLGDTWVAACSRQPNPLRLPARLRPPLSRPAPGGEAGRGGQVGGAGGDHHPAAATGGRPLVCPSVLSTARPCWSHLRLFSAAGGPGRPAGAGQPAASSTAAWRGRPALHQSCAALTPRVGAARGEAFRAPAHPAARLLPALPAATSAPRELCGGALKVRLAGAGGGDRGGGRGQGAAGGGCEGLPAGPAGGWVEV